MPVTPPEVKNCFPLCLVSCWSTVSFANHLKVPSIPKLFSTEPSVAAMLSHWNFKLIALLSAIGCVWAQTVTTTNGTVQGGKCEGYKVNYFWSIPYAQPPVGNLRFAAPKTYDKTYTAGVLKAISPAPRCPQFGTDFVEWYGAASEDW